ncbi:DNA-directed RNA polymerase subunit delta [Salibacterium halotolerans]|uniref:Probable DNA-directed RNA polymerase subunit delta n=1 Tax=Salibacterium halotolerans TaxID=1884432 RepID=A0A1I5V4J2_9BACI|nr:DNA-directed RNA polymerase subunit delta [Salibacterium halotolerans]SFQ02429.1 DNA-directed RNA polymerase subunit delta [Salibacterium halotolerans]
MSISDYNEEEIEEMSAIELAHILLEEENQPYEYGSLMNRIAKLKGMAVEETKNRQTKLFTSMNLDGRFVHLGENHWGLRGWYPLDQSDEDLSTTVKSEDTKKNQDASDEFEEDFDDDFEDIEDELDELSQEENAEDEEKTKPLDGFDSEDVEETEDDDSY